ncbi:MAG: flagellar hook-associated protein FlgK [Rhizobiaceae bacterium]|nr:flagellar hook-associated protein FlgK [Rhizobiaceae bacterium]
MSLTSALSIAQSALLNTSRQTSVVSRNISDASNPDYSRRQAVISSSAPGARVVEIQRAASEQLMRQNLLALSSFEGQNTLLRGLESLAMNINGVDNATSPATVIGQFQEALHLFSATPSNRTLAENAVDAARQVVRSLNDSTAAIQTARVQMDASISDAVADLNSLLSEFHSANIEVVNGTRANRDVSDALDKRDSVLKKISEYLPVSTLTRADNDMVIMTREGAMLYEKVPRAISFEPTPGYAPGALGNSIYVDGVAIVSGTGGNTNSSGKLAATLQLRDTVAPMMQNQLDEIARAMITAMAETDPNGVQPAAAGLFTWSGGPGVPTAGVIETGLAGSIRINATMDYAAGGDPILMRDGGANGAAYVWNTTGAASYSGLLINYGNQLDATQSFDVAAGLGSNGTVGTYAAGAISWLESLRSEAYRAAETKSAMMVRTTEALSNATGVNIDQEMSLLLDLEHAYEASARLIKAVDDMLSSLFAAVR